MAKDVKKTQKENVKEKKQDTKKGVKKEKEKKVVKKEIVKEEKVVVEENKEITKKNKTKEHKRNNESVVTVVKKIDENRKVILFCIVGFLLATLLFRFILWPDRIATLSDGTQPVVNIDGEAYTADQLYEDMKEQFSINVLLNKIDEKILNEMYPEDDEMTKAVKDTAEYYYSAYENYYGYTKEEFLSNNGFKSENSFIESLNLDYRRNKYYDDYVVKLIKEDEIDKYYKDEVYGDIDSKHILVQISDKEDGLKDEDAKKIANEIISKLNNGTSWEDVIAEYGDEIISEELGYNAFNASLEASYLKECRNLEVGKYSSTPVLTSYGYHIVYKIAQKETPALDEVKDDIIDILANKKKNDDTNLYNKALMAMREEAKLEFVDTVFADDYKELTNSYK